MQNLRFALKAAILWINWDVFSDGQVAYLYITGTNYDYYFDNQTDPTVAELNCTYKGQVDGQNRYGYKCFQRDN